MDKKLRLNSPTRLLISPLTFLVSSLFLISTYSIADSINFSDYPAGKPRKDAFFNYLLPFALEENKTVLKTRSQLEQFREKASLTGQQKQWIIKTANEYRMQSFDLGNKIHWETLLAKVDIIPPSLVLAQSANESAWGTSRFAREAKNYFGQWCFEPGCGVVPKHRPKDATYEVLEFNSPKQSVRSYILYLNTNSSYEKLRSIRQNLREEQKLVTGSHLANGLEKYSARGLAYVEEIKKMIRYNKLEQLDSSL